LVERIHRQGPLPFDTWMEAALYDPEAGFFARGGGAGRAGSDFLTSPEIGATFGALVARAVDGWWDRLGRPDPFLVVDAGAGRGQLARDVLRAGPRCAAALRYVLVERSPVLRTLHDDHLRLEPADLALGPAVPPAPDEEPVAVPGLGPLVTSLGELPAGPVVGVVVANELVDNLPVRIVERTSTGGWLEVRVGTDGAAFVELTIPADGDLSDKADRLAGDHPVPAGARLPVPTGMTAWLSDCAAMLRRGAVILLDYADSLAGLLARGQSGWLRTYRGHQRGGLALDAPGTQDITVDVNLDALRRAAVRAGFTVALETTQAEWLRSLGIADLVAEARAAWQARTGTDLATLAARSRVSEADALLDPAGLGAHRVAVLTKGI
jgi:SAM-dependent MidA family methyltransferase